MTDIPLIPEIIVEEPTVQDWNTTDKMRFFQDAIGRIAREYPGDIIRKAYKMAYAKIRLIINQKMPIPENIDETEREYLSLERDRYAKNTDDTFLVSPDAIVLLSFTWEAAKKLLEDVDDLAIEKIRSNL